MHIAFLTADRPGGLRLHAEFRRRNARDQGQLQDRRAVDVGDDQTGQQDTVKLSINRGNEFKKDVRLKADAPEKIKGRA